MTFWNEELRSCRKCKANVEFKDEPKQPCPACGAPVRFYDYRPLPPVPPDPSEPAPKRLLDSPTTTFLLGVIAVFGLVTLVAIHQRLIVAAVSALSAIGFAVFGFLRDREARKNEDRLEQLELVAKWSSSTRSRLQDAVARYNALLMTGDKRIEHYFEDIYGRAVAEREAARSLRDAAVRQRAEGQAAAERLRDDAARDREAARFQAQQVRNEASQARQAVEQRIFRMAERFVDDHRKWSTAKMRPDSENYQRRKNELEKAFGFVERLGYQLPTGLRHEALTNLRNDFERVLREHALREEQRRINQLMREEERLRREREEVVKQTEQREQDLQRRLEQSLRAMEADIESHRNAHMAEVEELRRQLEEAQTNAERAKSMAQLHQGRTRLHPL